MDFSEHTDDDLADVLGAGIREAERRNEQKPDGVSKALMRRALSVAHMGLQHAKKRAVQDGTIQPFSGGDPDKED